jgi:hypothetical protein
VLPRAPLVVWEVGRWWFAVVRGLVDVCWHGAGHAVVDREQTLEFCTPIQSTTNAPQSPPWAT